MKTILPNLMMVLVFLVVSCDNEEPATQVTDGWLSIADLEGGERSGAVAAVADGKVFVGLGYNEDDGYLKDFWSYNSFLDLWSPIDSFPAEGRSDAVAFALNDNVYVGTGYENFTYKSDFWKLNPADSSWERVADFPGAARRGAVAFVLGDKAYVGTGYNGEPLNDFYSFDGTSWTAEAALPGEPRTGAFSFVIDNKAFVGSGDDANGNVRDDFYCLDPSTGMWAAKTSLIAQRGEVIHRSGAIGFATDNRAFITTGFNTDDLSSTYEYDVDQDFWNDGIKAFEGGSRNESIVFTLRDRAYIGLGRNGRRRFDDIWEFIPAGN